MERITQDNEPLTFQSLGLAAAIVINRIRNAQALRELQPDEQKDGPRSDDANGGDAEKKERKADKEYVERRLRELAAWERRLRLGK